VDTINYQIVIFPINLTTKIEEEYVFIKRLRSIS